MKTKESKKYSPPVASTTRRKRSPRRQPPALRGWDAIEAQIDTVEEPANYAMEHDHYARGLPKRSRPSGACDTRRKADKLPPTLYERLKPFIGKAKGLPPDASINHDHYLYGLPKRR